MCIALVACCACDAFKKVERRDIAPDEFRAMSAGEAHAMKEKSPFLKAHMRNGDVFVLQNWSAADDRVVVGNGSHYDPARNLIASGNLQVPIDSVVVFETNQQVTSNAAAALTVLAVVTVAVGIACALNPKACFGSCPTFFVAGHARPLAEGFSSSIAPSLEATDVDQLDIGAVPGGRFELVMKNEAYETHVVRHVDLLAVPHLEGASAFAARDGSFWRARAVTPPVYAEASEGDCSAKLRAVDGAERFSPADSSNLAAKETVEVAFADAGAGRHALVIASRQSLLSTFLLYQTYAYMGNQTGYWLAELERGHLGDAGASLVDLVGGIVVSIEVAPGEWATVDEVREFGPIAVDRHLIAFDAPATWTGRARLTMTQGAWRVDQVALASELERVEPIRLAPSVVEKNGAADETARAQLVDPARALTTLPGDAYTLVYQIPRGGATYDLFLESRGYYLEWIRDAWIEEENATRLAELFFDPATALVRLAPEYKRVEAGMERTFWESRYAKP